MKKVYADLLNLMISLNLFQTIAIYNNHIDRARLGKIVYGTPACFVEIQNNDSLNLGRKINSSTLSIRIHIVNIQLDDGYGNMDMDLTIFKLRDIIDSNIISFMPSNCGAISYEKESQEYKHGNLYHYISFYQCNWIDTSAFVQYVFEPYLYVWNLTDIEWQECNALWNNAQGLQLGLNINN